MHYNLGAHRRWRDLGGRADRPQRSGACPVTKISAGVSIRAPAIRLTVGDTHEIHVADLL